MAFKKRIGRNGKQVDTLAFSGEDEIALDYAKIQKAFCVDFYDAYPKQEVFNRFLKLKLFHLLGTRGSYQELLGLDL